MPWALRGLRDGVVTTRWPRRPDDYFTSWSGVVELVAPEARVDPVLADHVVGLCPTGAISRNQSRLEVDRGACIACGRCVAAAPELVRWQQGSGLGALDRRRLVSPRPAEPSEEDQQRLRQSLAVRVRAFGRSVHLRHVDAGSDGSEEWEIAALTNPVYDIHRLGLFFTASPRHADVLLVTGIGATGMAAPLKRTREAMPDPVVVVAIGTDACSAGLLGDSYAGSRGIGGLLDVDVWVPGSPPSPFAILHGLLLALGRVAERAEGAVR